MVNENGTGTMKTSECRHPHDRSCGYCKNLDPISCARCGSPKLTVPSTGIIGGEFVPGISAASVRCESCQPKISKAKCWYIAGAAAAAPFIYAILYGLGHRNVVGY